MSSVALNGGLSRVTTFYDSVIGKKIVSASDVYWTPSPRLPPGLHAIHFGEFVYWLVSERA